MLLIAAAVVVAIVIYYMQNGSLLGGSYQAVFLSNGQVYFGKASSINSAYVTLRDIYYLQVSQVLQPVQGNQQQPRQQLSLAKLGLNELHKPKDLMRINRNHVIFIEDLQSDSQVVQAIESYKETQ